MSTYRVIYGSVTFPAREAARWRASKLVAQHDDWPASVGQGAFEPTTVAAVLDDAADFGAQPDGQFIDLDEDERSIAVRASLEESLYGLYADRLAAALRTAAGFGGEGEVRFAELPGWPDRLVLASGRAAFATTKRVPDDDEAAQQSLVERMEALMQARSRAAKKATAKKATAKKATAKKATAKKATAKKATAKKATAKKRTAVSPTRPARGR